MYTIHESLSPYDAELDPLKRLEILDSLPEFHGKDYLYILYYDRYSDNDGRDRKNVDWRLWRCICLQQLYHKGGFFKRFRQASSGEKIFRACADIWQMSRGIAKTEGVEERMRLWSGAFSDELFDYDSLCREEYLWLDS